MQIHELLELLNEADPGDEVRLAYQPSWPLAAHVAGVATAEDTDEELVRTRCGSLVEVTAGDEAHHLRRADDADHEPVVDGEPSGDGLEPGVVWIVAGDAPDHPYAPRAAFSSARRW